MKAIKCVAISDFHCHPLPTILKDITADLLLIAGDWSYKATTQEILNFKGELGVICDNEQFKEIVWINGNHELGLEYNNEASQAIATYTGSHYLENEEIVLTFGHRKVKIWGSPVTPYFGGWAWNAHRGEEIANYWKKIPEKLDILITHGPPFGILDVIPSGARVGCEDLLDKLDNGLKDPPKNIVFGHVHHAAGQRIYRTPFGKTINCFNVSICNERYDNFHPPTEFYL